MQYTLSMSLSSEKDIYEQLKVLEGHIDYFVDTDDWPEITSISNVHVSKRENCYFVFCNGDAESGKEFETLREAMSYIDRKTELYDMHEAVRFTYSNVVYVILAYDFGEEDNAETWIIEKKDV